MHIRIVLNELMIANTALKQLTSLIFISKYSYSLVIFKYSYTDLPDLFFSFFCSFMTTFTGVCELMACLGWLYFFMLITVFILLYPDNDTIHCCLWLIILLLLMCYCYYNEITATQI